MKAQTHFINTSQPISSKAHPVSQSSITSKSSSLIDELKKKLPPISDSERHAFRCQLLETLAQEMSSQQVQQVLAATSEEESEQEQQRIVGEGGATGSDRGEISDINIIDVAVHLEGLIQNKFPDSSSPNYKTLSKKILQSLKSSSSTSKASEQRKLLCDCKDYSVVQDLFNSFLAPNRNNVQSTGGIMGQMPQESSGSAAAGISSIHQQITPPPNQSNPFAFSSTKTQSNPPPSISSGGLAPSSQPPQSKRAGPPQQRFPQQRFVANPLLSGGAVDNSASNSGEQEQSNIVGGVSGGTTGIEMGHKKAEAIMGAAVERDESHGAAASDKIKEGIDANDEHDRPQMQAFNSNQQHEDAQRPMSNSNRNKQLQSMSNAPENLNQSYNDNLAESGAADLSSVIGGRDVNKNKSQKQSNQQQVFSQISHNLKNKDTKEPKEQDQNTQSAKLQQPRKQSNQQQNMTDDFAFFDNLAKQSAQQQNEQMTSLLNKGTSNQPNQQKGQSAKQQHSEEQKNQQTHPQSKEGEEQRDTKQAIYGDHMIMSGSGGGSGDMKKQGNQQQLQHHSPLHYEEQMPIKLKQDQSSGSGQFESEYMHQEENAQSHHAHLSKNNQEEVFIDQQPRILPHFQEYPSERITEEGALSDSRINQEEEGFLAQYPNTLQGNQVQSSFGQNNQQNPPAREEYKALYTEQEEQQRSGGDVLYQDQLIQNQAYSKTSKQTIKGNHIEEANYNEQSQSTYTSNHQSNTNFKANQRNPYLEHPSIDQSESTANQSSSSVKVKANMQQPMMLDQNANQQNSSLYPPSQLHEPISQPIDFYNIQTNQQNQHQHSKSRNTPATGGIGGEGSIGGDGDLPPVIHSHYSTLSNDQSLSNTQLMSNPPPYENLYNRSLLQSRHEGGSVYSTPQMKGFIQSYQASRPPQSVASVNLTNLEDSEALVRAYKKKKGELEQIKERFYKMETEYFTEKQKNMLLEEEVVTLRTNLIKSDRVLKDLQMREQKKEGELAQKQLMLKTKENEEYQRQLILQKSENQKLRDKMKEMINSRKSGSISYSNTSNGSGGSLQAAENILYSQQQQQIEFIQMQQAQTVRERDDLLHQQRMLKQDLEQKDRQMAQKELGFEQEKKTLIEQYEAQLKMVTQQMEQMKTQQQKHIEEVMKNKAASEYKQQDQSIHNQSSPPTNKAILKDSCVPTQQTPVDSQKQTQKSHHQAQANEQQKAAYQTYTFDDDSQNTIPVPTQITQKKEKAQAPVQQIQTLKIDDSNDDSEDFIGFYQSQQHKKQDSVSGSSSVNSNNYNLMQSYFKDSNNDTDKQSSAPPSSSQNQHQKTQQHAVPQQLNKGGPMNKEEGENFFGQLSQKSASSNSNLDQTFSQKQNITQPQQYIQQQQNPQNQQFQNKQQPTSNLKLNPQGGVPVQSQTNRQPYNFAMEELTETAHFQVAAQPQAQTQPVKSQNQFSYANNTNNYPQSNINTSIDSSGSGTKTTTIPKNLFD